jgi:CheY-like chemotaxis protein
MTVTCPSCHAALTIPDDRLPKGRVVTAACPKCKGPIRIDPAETAAPVAATVPPRPAAPEERVTFDEQRQPRALICMNSVEQQAQIMAGLKQRGYAAQAAADPAEALKRLRFSSYAVAVLHEGFGAEAERNSVMDSIAEMGTGARRRLHVVLVSETVPAHDPMAAFASSVDLVVHPQDLAHLPEALQQSLAEAEQKYRVLLESLHDLGKV